MDIDLITNVACRYGLHTCRYCQAVVIDLSNVVGESSHQTDIVRVGGQWVFDGATNDCVFFQFCVQNTKIPAGRSESSYFLGRPPTADLAHLLTLVVKVGHHTANGGVCLNCTIVWDRVDRHPSLDSPYSPFWVNKGKTFCRLLLAKGKSIRNQKVAILFQLE
jgi:hypothetical protein